MARLTIASVVAGLVALHTPLPGARAAAQLPPAAPAGLSAPDFAAHLETIRALGQTIVARDLLDIVVFEAPELSRAVRVSDDGMVSVPLLGPIQAAGRTPRELEIALQDTLRSTYMRDPRVSVTVQQPAPRPIFVVGEVNQPGAYVPSGDERLTVLRAVAMAHGAKPTAAQGRAYILRPRPDGEPIQIPVNVSDVAKGKAPDPALAPNDVLYLPKHTQRAFALGLVDALVGIVTFRVPLRR